MSIQKNVVSHLAFNPSAELPYELRLPDFEIAMQDVYDFFYDVNLLLASKGLQRLDDMLRPANMSETEVYLAHVTPDDFRKNPRGELGTRTATLDRAGLAKLRASWIYRCVASDS